jgi:hypothetical protein
MQTAYILVDKGFGGVYCPPTDYVHDVTCIFKAIILISILHKAIICDEGEAIRNT